MCYNRSLGLILPQACFLNVSPPHPICPFFLKKVKHTGSHQCYPSDTHGFNFKIFCCLVLNLSHLQVFQKTYWPWGQDQSYSNSNSYKMFSKCSYCHLVLKLKHSQTWVHHAYPPGWRQSPIRLLQLRGEKGKNKSLMSENRARQC